MKGTVVSVSRSAERGIRKNACTSIDAVAGEGVVGDIHCGRTIRHLARIRKDPSAPNLRQVHLFDLEIVDELREMGFVIAPGDMGENLVVRDLRLLELSRGTILSAGPECEIQLTGLRNPCKALEEIGTGLLAAAAGRSCDGSFALKAGVMATVRRGGTITVGDVVVVVREPSEHAALEPV